ncbi:MAG: DUF2569 domain-containing protein, partial [Alphaproteobacteria bacterium]|nr:DUF2569 domain-containing protein [Alphaproteobacteria bacterium]
MIDRVSRRLHWKSVQLVAALQANLHSIAIWWVILISCACVLRLAFAVTRLDPGISALGNVLPYAAVVMAPVATLFLGLRLFSPNQIHAQP